MFWCGLNGMFLCVFFCTLNCPNKAKLGWIYFIWQCVCKMGPRGQFPWNFISDDSLSQWWNPFDAGMNHFCYWLKVWNHSNGVIWDNKQKSDTGALVNGVSFISMVTYLLHRIPRTHFIKRFRVGNFFWTPRKKQKFQKATCTLDELIIF